MKTSVRLASTILQLGTNKLKPFLKSWYKVLKIFLSLAALGLRCCTWAFSSCGEQGLLFIAVHGLLMLLIVVASLVAEHGL